MDSNFGVALLFSLQDGAAFKRGSAMQQSSNSCHDSVEKGSQQENTAHQSYLNEMSVDFMRD